MENSQELLDRMLHRDDGNEYVPASALRTNAEQVATRGGETRSGSWCDVSGDGGYASMAQELENETHPLSARAVTLPVSGVWRSAWLTDVQQLCVTYRQIVRAVLNPFGTVCGQQSVDSYELLDYAKECLNLSEQNSTEQLLRVKREPRPTCMLNVKVLELTNENEDAPPVDIILTVCRKASTFVSTARLREEDVLERVNAELNKAVSVELDEPKERRVRVDIRKKSLPTGESRNDDDNDLLGYFYQNVSELPSSGCVKAIRLVGASGALSDYNVKIRFTFSVQNLVIDVGRGRIDTLFLAICRAFFVHEVKKREFPKEEERVTRAPEMSKQESEIFQSPIKLGLDGVKLSDNGLIILEVLAQQYGFTSLQVMAVQTLALFLTSLDLTVPDAALMFRIDSLNKSWEEAKAARSRLGVSEKAHVSSCLRKVCEVLLGKISSQIGAFPPVVQDSDAHRNLSFVRLLQDVSKSELWKALLAETAEQDFLVDQLSLSVQTQTKAWYRTSVEIPPRMDSSMPFELASSHLRSGILQLEKAVKRVERGLRLSSKLYPTLFEKLGLDYWRTCLEPISDQLNRDLQLLCPRGKTLLQHGNADNSTSLESLYAFCQTFLRLFLAVMDLEEAVQTHTSLSPEGHKKSNAPNLLKSHEKFEVLIPEWFNVLERHCSEAVKKAANMDKVDQKSTTTTRFITRSALEFENLIQVVANDWRVTLEWPEAVVSYLVTARMLDLCCEVARTYSISLLRHVQRWPSSRVRNPLNRLRDVCLILNNLASASAIVSRLPDILDLEMASEALPSQNLSASAGGSSFAAMVAIDGNAPGRARRALCTTATQKMITNCHQDLHAIMMHATQHVIVKACTGLDWQVKAMLQTCPQATSEVDIGMVLTQLLEYITNINNLFKKEEGLDQVAYQGLILALWNVTMAKMLSSTRDQDDDLQSKEMYTNILAALKMNDGIMDFFHKELRAELQREQLLTSAFKELEWHLTVKSAADEQLYSLFCKEKFDHRGSTKSDLGSLDVSASVTSDDRLAVKIYSGEGIQRVSPESKYQTYLNVHVEPESIVHPLNRSSLLATRAYEGAQPVFDEVFAIPLVPARSTAIFKDCFVVLIVWQVKHWDPQKYHRHHSDFVLGEAILDLSKLGQPNSRVRHSVPILPLEKTEYSALVELKKRADAGTSFSPAHSIWSNREKLRKAQAAP